MTRMIEILDAGPIVTVQDAGRAGFLRYGVSASGAMDDAAYQVANALVGNAPGAAVLEFAMMGGRFRLPQGGLIAVTGGAVSVTVEGRPVDTWESAVVPPGGELRIGALRGATWGYLAVSGGIDCPPVMGSRSTHLRSAIGGLEGRRLAAGDILPLGPLTADPRPCRLQHTIRPRGGPFAVVPGPQDDYFDAATWRRFLHQGFTVSPQRDRMAMTLDGPPIQAALGHDIVSDGTLMGSIQVPPSGRLFLLMADRQTTGGYPKIATVASFDLGRLAQVPSGRRIHFRALSAEEAATRTLEARARLATALAELAPL